MGLFHRTPAVDAGAARQLVSDGAVLLDVREPGEWNAGHAPQAIHQPLGRLAVADRRFTAGRQVVVVCRSGNRSQHAVKALRAAGVDALNLSGGMRAWQSAGGSVVDRKGRPGAVI
jgi:rhodanese-related sulfurtransferase